MRPGFGETRAIVVLAELGATGLGKTTSASVFGAVYFGPDRTSKGYSMGGGGDYPAQMLLGRLRKKGWAATPYSEGSSQWELTSSGRAIAQWWNR